MITPLKQYILDYEAGTRPFEEVAAYVKVTFGYTLSQSELDTFRQHMILEDFLRQISYGDRE